MIHCQFAIVSDLHIALSHTIWDHPTRFHLVELSIPALEKVFQHLEPLDLDFILLPGDLTQHGEPDNHRWLQQRLAKLPFPAYVIPGNHDIPTQFPTEKTIGFEEFSQYYSQFGYDCPHGLDYTQEIIPGLQLIALNSNQFDEQGQQVGRLRDRQLQWLKAVLEEVENKFVMVMIHHNIIEHIPGQTNHPLGKRYMLENAPALREILKSYGVKLILTGHLHVQDIAEDQGLYEITTGSLVSYPHPYRLIELYTDENKQLSLDVKSYRVDSLPGWEDLPQFSRKFMGDRSYAFTLKLLTLPPLNLSLPEAEKLAPQLQYFWATIAEGDAILSFPDLPSKVRNYFESFSDTHLIDNQVTLKF